MVQASQKCRGKLRSFAVLGRGKNQQARQRTTDNGQLSSAQLRSSDRQNSRIERKRKKPKVNHLSSQLLFMHRFAHQTFNWTSVCLGVHLPSSLVIPSPAAARLVESLSQPTGISGRCKEVQDFTNTLSIPSRMLCRSLPVLPCADRPSADSSASMK